VSCEANGLTVDLKGALDPDHIGDVGIPAGSELLAFTDAVELGANDVDSARRRLADAIGAEATLEAAAIIAIFNGLVRVADGTGIQLDEGVFTASVDERDLLGIDRFAGAANSADVTASATSPSAVQDLFG
jgi:hypothetical protein